MRSPGRSAIARRRAGLTLTELIVATGLATMLMILLATTWRAFGRPTLEVEARARIQQEGILAVQSLACDFSGFLPDTPGRTGNIQTGQQCPYQAATSPWNINTPRVLLLNFYGASTSDYIFITYELSGNTLVRTNSSTGVATTVARYVTAFSAASDPSDPSQVVITLSIAYRNFTTTFTLVGVAST